MDAQYSPLGKRITLSVDFSALPRADQVTLMTDLMLATGLTPALYADATPQQISHINKAWADSTTKFIAGGK